MNSRANIWFVLALSLLVANGATLIMGQIVPSDWQTVAEKTQFRGTSLSAEVESFVRRCDEQAGHVQAREFGKTAEQRPMTAVAISREPYQWGQQDERTIALIIANIHSGECDGKEAMLQMLRELSLNPKHPWLDQLVIVIVPNYNADGNDRVGLNNRPGQVGPELGMGMRENAQHLDLNRDFMKLDSPEAKNLVGLIDQVNPHLFIDCHTTNGSKHQYALTYDIPHNPTTSSVLRDFLRQEMMPAITAKMAERGLLSFYYGTPDRTTTRWQTYGHEPRYSTEYVGLRGRLSILSEAYAYDTFEGRVKSSYAFVSECLNYLAANAAPIREILASIDRDLIDSATREPHQVTLALDSKMAAYDQKFIHKAYRNNEPVDIEMEYWGRYEPTTTTPLPYAYLIPADQSRCLDRLRMHGVKLQTLTQSQELEIEYEIVRDIQRANQRFQQHAMVKLDTEMRRESRQVPAGMVVVQTAQPLGLVAAYLLEARSNDGFVTWNFLDSQLQVGREYPIWRINDPVSLQSEPLASVPRRERITAELIDAAGNLLETQPLPVKFFPGTNQYVLDSWGRETLVDPATGSFVRPARGRAANSNLSRLFREQLNWDETTANSVASGQRIEAKGGEHFALIGPKQAAILNAASDRAFAIESQGHPVQVGSFSSDGKHFLFVANGSLMTTHCETGLTKTLVERRHELEQVGLLDWVYQEELYGRGNYVGYWISPDSQWVCALALDETQVPRYPLSDQTAIAGKVDWMFYPKAGDPQPVVRLAWKSLTQDTPAQWADFGELPAGHLISDVSWSDSSQHVYVQVQNREQTWLDLWTLSPSAGKTQKLFRDATPAWIESPGRPWELDDGRFVWLSPRNGYKHLYLYDAVGQTSQPITTGNWQVLSISGMSPDKKLIYFTANPNNPLGAQGFRISLASGSRFELQPVTPPEGTHELELSSDGTYLIDTYSTSTQPARSFLRDAEGKLLRQLTISHDDRLDYLQINPPKFVEVPSANDQPLDGMLILPPEFEPTKKYPVVMFAYAGPQTSQVRDAFGGKWYLFHQMLAQHGFVVWVCDNQSASRRSMENCWTVHRNLGELELRDLNLGLDWLCQQDWVDDDRIGMWGWSYGGYITAYALTHSDRFRCGISGAPVTDWKNYDSIYTERLMGLPSENPEGYQKSSVLESAAQLHGRLLLIHGTMDDNVHPSNSIQLIDRLQQQGTLFQFMAYPRTQHGVTDPQKQQHLRRMMLDFFQQQLQPTIEND